MVSIPLDIWQHHIVPLLGIDELIALDTVSKAHRRLTAKYWQPRLTEFEIAVTEQCRKSYRHAAQFDVGLVSRHHSSAWYPNAISVPDISYTPYCVKIADLFCPCATDFEELSPKQKIVAFLSGFRSRANSNTRQSIKYISYQLLVPFVLLYTVGSLVGFNVIECVIALLNVLGITLFAYRFNDREDVLDHGTAAARYIRSVRGRVLVMIMIVLFGYTEYSVSISLIALTLRYTMHETYTSNDSYDGSMPFQLLRTSRWYWSRMILQPELEVWRKALRHSRDIILSIRTPITWSYMEGVVLSTISGHPLR